MNLVFFGSSQFAVASLKALLDKGYRVCCVVTQPDRPKGRGLCLVATPVKELALKNKLKIFQPEDINTQDAINFLISLKADLFIVVAYGQILSQRILDIPKIFCVNVHASILPKYRGAAPINWAIINGDRITGVTIMKMIRKMDAGPIIMQKQIEIYEDDTAITLEDKLSRLGAQALIESLNAIESKDYKLIPQDETKSSLAPKLQKQDGLIDWNKSAEEIYNLIKGCAGWPDAFTYYRGRLLKIFKARVALPVSRLPGEVVKVDKEGILVATAKGSLIIKELQIEGKRRMTIEEFIAGYKINIGERLGKK